MSAVGYHLGPEAEPGRSLHHLSEPRVKGGLAKSREDYSWQSAPGCAVDPKLLSITSQLNEESDKGVRVKVTF